jgi:hypothetical protein
LEAHTSTVAALTRAFEKAGIEFIGDNGQMSCSRSVSTSPTVAALLRLKTPTKMYFTRVVSLFSDALERAAAGAAAPSCL